MAETKEPARESKASRQAAGEQEKSARAKADQEKPANQPGADVEVAGEPDPEWVALANRARAGGDDAAEALIDAYERGLRTGVERAEALRSEGGKVSITTEDVAALTGPATGAVRGQPRRVIVSEGVMRDLESNEWVVDPGTGHKLTMDRDSGEVTVVDRVTDEPVEHVQVVGPGNDPQHQTD